MARVLPSLADSVVVVLSPVLIVGMVTSLVFFLTDILYAGQYGDRVLWTMFWFTGACVLTARISIEMGAAKARAYSLVLAGVTFVALGAFIQEVPGGPLAGMPWVVHLVTIAVVWWSVNQLTWDCTFVDEASDAADRGLLASSGLDTEAGAGAAAAKADAEGREAAGAAKRTRHAPGVWVLYFALAALPLFGVGQSLIPATEVERRSWSFGLMAVYVSCSLGLLVTTSFLGLRHYLRKRGLQMPATMTGVWMGLGAGLVLGFVLIAGVLPRPHSETPLVSLAQLTGKDRDASKNALLRGGDTGKGDGAAGKSEVDPNAEKSFEGKKGAAEYEGKSDQSGGKSGEQKGDSSKGGKSGESKANGKSSPGKNGDSKKGQGKDAKSKADGDKSGGGAGKEPEADGKGQSPGQPPPPSFMPQLGQLQEIIKWIVIGLLVLGIILVLILFGASWLGTLFPPLKRWADGVRAWLARLFGLSPAVAEDDIVEAEVERPPTPFRAFRNPFEGGGIGGNSVPELLAYTFAALQAWGREHGCPHEPSETAGEFLVQLMAVDGDLQMPLQRFSNVYQRQAYATLVTNKAAATEAVRAVWDALRDAR